MANDVFGQFHTVDQICQLLEGDNRSLRNFSLTCPQVNQYRRPCFLSRIGPKSLDEAHDMLMRALSLTLHAYGVEWNFLTTKFRKCASITSQISLFVMWRRNLGRIIYEAYQNDGRMYLNLSIIPRSLVRSTTSGFAAIERLRKTSPRYVRCANEKGLADLCEIVGEYLFTTLQPTQ